MSKSRASKLKGYRSTVSRQKNDVYKFKQKKRKKIRIKLIDVDSHNFPNLPLMKLSAWHK